MLNSGTEAMRVARSWAVVTVRGLKADLARISDKRRRAYLHKVIDDTSAWLEDLDEAIARHASNTKGASHD